MPAISDWHGRASALDVHAVSLHACVHEQARNLSSAMSAASSACDHIRNWVLGTEGDSWVSMGVFSDGSYGAPKVRIIVPASCAVPAHMYPCATQLLPQQLRCLHMACPHDCISVQIPVQAPIHRLHQRCYC